MDHIQRNCPKNTGGSGGGFGGGNTSSMRCYNCNEMGHISRNCPIEA
jgi:hypothetical protein